MRWASRPDVSPSPTTSAPPDTSSTPPDLFDGRTFAELADGVGHAEQIGFGTIIEGGQLAAEGLPNEIVYAGFSLGVMPAQMLAQTRPGARGAPLFHSCVPPAEFGGPWPQDLPLPCT
jgi:hypothetical protein